MRFHPARLLIPLQGAVAVTALAVAAMWPPSSGRMLLIPITARNANATAKIALAGHALLLGPGPFAGSLIVNGDRARISHQNRAWNVVIMAAPPGSCGAGAKGGGAA